MEISCLLETTKLTTVCDVRDDQDNGLRSPRPPSLKREGSNFDGLAKPRRSVQFPSDENLVFIKEIPPRGFFGSDVSDSEESDGEDDGESGEESESDDDEDDGDDDDHDHDHHNKSGIRPKTSVIPNTRRSYLWPRSDTNKPKLASAKSSTFYSNAKSDTKCASVKRPRLLSRSQKRGNGMENRSKGLNKFRKNNSKPPTVMKPTISSKTKQSTKNSKATPPMQNTKQSQSPKCPTKITIDSPIPVTKETRVSDDNDILYNYYVSGKMCQVKGFIFPLDQSDTTIDYLPKISDMDFKPFSKHRRHNAWQLANGTLDTTLFHTPSIAPMWENIQTVSIAKLKPKKHDPR